MRLNMSEESLKNCYSANFLASAVLTFLKCVHKKDACFQCLLTSKINFLNCTILYSTRNEK